MRRLTLLAVAVAVLALSVGAARAQDDDAVAASALGGAADPGAAPPLVPPSSAHGSARRERQSRAGNRVRQERLRARDAVAASGRDNSAQQANRQVVASLVKSAGLTDGEKELPLQAAPRPGHIAVARAFPPVRPDWNPDPATKTVPSGGADGDAAAQDEATQAQRRKDELKFEQDYQTLPCELSRSPSKCKLCVESALKRAPKSTPAALTKALTEPTCSVCASMPTLALQDYCVKCVLDFGYEKGCAACAGRLHSSLAVSIVPKSYELAQAAQCFGCYASSNQTLRSTNVCSPCWLSPSLKEHVSCGRCVVSARNEHQARICAVCGNNTIANQKQCYGCIEGASIWPAKKLCGLAPLPNQDAKTTRQQRQLLPGYISCLSAARTDTAANLCVSCMLNRARGKDCFNCLIDLFADGLTTADLSLRGGLCSVPQK